MSLKGKRVAILAEQDFEDVELTEPLKAMKEAGAQIFIVGSGNDNMERKDIKRKKEVG